jgi:hypothetical protein
VRLAIAVLALALAASIALGLLGLWPDLRGNSLGDRRAKARISSAVDRALGQDDNVTRVRLDYLPGRAMVEVQAFNTGRRFCFLVIERFGDRVNREDARRIACDF